MVFLSFFGLNILCIQISCKEKIGKKTQNVKTQLAEFLTKKLASAKDWLMKFDGNN